MRSFGVLVLPLVLGVLALSTSLPSAGAAEMVAAAVQEPAPGQSPGPGERTVHTRQPPLLHGLTALVPIRLHLSRGGSVEGRFGGVDLEAQELLLVLPHDAFRVHLSLVEALTPLGQLPPPGSASAQRPPPGILLQRHSELRLQPTWRSHAGVALSFVLPGAGQFIQKENKVLGLLFLSSVAGCIGSGLLALYGPSSASPGVRRATAGIFFGLAGTITVGSAVHAHNAGRELREVEVGPERGIGAASR